MSADRAPTFSRRRLLQSAAAPLLVPDGLRWLPDGDDLCVLVLELEGGNDGLNTVVPLDDPRYAAARPHLSAVRRQARRIGDSAFGLHGALAGLHRLVAAGDAAVIQGVGYPRPDRSHFRSRDIWHVGDPAYDAAAASEATGWLGRAADALAAAGAVRPALCVGNPRLPLCLRGARTVAPAIETLRDFEVRVIGDGDGSAGRRAALRDGATAGSGSGGPGAFVSEVAAEAWDSAEALSRTLARYRPRAGYPDTPLARAVQLAARLLVSGFGTRLLWTSFGGFDTHSQQLGTHAGLLHQLDAALAALIDDLRGHRALARTLVLVHSEFGRRVAENGSLGTDHGAAGPVLALGAGVTPGLRGATPDLDDLVDGDLRHGIDFRAVYAAIALRLGVDPDRVVPTAAGLPAFTL